MLATSTLDQLAFSDHDTSADKQVVFEHLVASYSIYLHRYAYWRCQDHTLAEDLVQETFLRAWKNLHQLENARTAKSWLTTILRREFARLFERTRPEIDQEISPETLPGGINQGSTTEAFALRKALTKLPEKYKEPLILQVLAGFTMEEIASILGLSKNAVMTRVFRAREKLRTVLAPEESVA